MERLERWVTAPGRALAVVSVIMVTMMMLHVTVDVLAKYLFNAPIHSTLGVVSAYYMVGCVFLPLAYSTQHGGQIMVELFTRKMPADRLRKIDSGIDLAMGIYLAFFTWQSWVEAVRRTGENEMWETAVSLLVVWPSRWIVVAGFATMTLFVLFRGFCNLRRAGHTA